MSVDVRYNTTAADQLSSLLVQTAAKLDELATVRANRYNADLTRWTGANKDSFDRSFKGGQDTLAALRSRLLQLKGRVDDATQQALKLRASDPSSHVQ